MKNIQIQKTGHGHFKITCKIYGKYKSTVTTDTMSIDNYNSDLRPREIGVCHQTKIQASKSLYDQIKRAHY